MRKSKQLIMLQYIFAIVLLFWTLGPFIWMFITSISYQVDLLSLPHRWLPERVTFERYISIISDPKNDIAYAFRRSMMNSLTVAVSVTISALLIGGLAAHAFIKYKFKFSAQLVYVFLFTYMIPSIVIVIPLYMTLQKLGMLDQKITLILLHLTFAVPFVIWIMQGFFKQISQDYYEAAMLDGCSRLQILKQIVIPIVQPGILATIIFAFLLSWDEFFFSLLFTSTLEAKTISVAISEFSGKHAIDMGMVATGGILASLPPLLIAFVFQRFLVRGMTAGGIKG